MRSNRRTFLKTTAAAAAASALPMVRAFAAEELKLASFVPPTHSIWVNPITPWAKEVEAKSGGKMTVRLFPSMQLGGKPPELYRQMATGIADIVFTLPGYTSGDFPMLSMTELPGTAESAEDGTRKLWANMKFFEKELEAAKVLMLWNSDNAGLMSREKPIRTLADMKGMRIRTPSAAQSAQLEALGAIPVSMPVTQIYNSLERGVIDATMIPLSAMLDFKLLEVVKHLTTGAPLGRSPFMVTMNRKRYEGLPPDLKKVIDDTTGLEMSLGGARSYDKKNTEALDQAKKQREVYVLPADEFKKWMDVFQPVIKNTAAEADKKGLPGSAFLKAYNLTS
ncbi:TRAP transporter substrate-binding protein [Pseudorhodoplanes sp.]|uniref:TRAP transporter substrate-binding protein n=1 Tax=Pseudorhodoplanes sp. TaxID=1934341 RepID=UPI003919428B